jgi:hypothetical protein
MMRIIETLAEDDRWPLESTRLCTMHGIPAHETTTSAEEQISIYIRKSMERIKGITVYGGRDTRRKGRVFVKHMSVGIMVH